MAKPVALVEAELLGLCRLLDGQIKTDRQDIADLWVEVEASRARLSKSDDSATKEQVTHLGSLLGELRKQYDESEKLRAAHREEFVASRTQFQEHVKQYEKWDARRWGLIGVFVATLLSLVANLMVIALRTSAK